MRREQSVSHITTRLASFRVVSRYIRSSLTRRFVLAVVITNMLVIGLLSWELVDRERAVADQHRFERGRTIARIVAAAAGPSLSTNNHVELQRIARAATAAEVVNYVVFTDQSRRVKADTRATPTKLPVSGNASRVLRDPAMDVELLATTKSELILNRAVVVDDKVAGHLYVSVRRPDVDAQRREVSFIALLVGAALILLGGLVAFLTARSVTARLAKVAVIANEFRLGRRGIRGRDNSPDEVGTVVQGINAMLQSVEKSERSLQDMFRIAQIGAWRYNAAEDRLEWSNTLRDLFGLEPSSLPPTPESFLGSLPKKHRGSLASLLEQENRDKIARFSFDYARLDGDHRTYWIEARSEFNEDTGEIDLVGLCQDITDRETAAAQLRQAQKMEAVGQLTGGLAHDFNNLLAVIIGNLDFLGESLPENDPSGDTVREALAAALRGSELTRQLLAFSRRQALSPKIIDLNELVAGISSFWRRTLGETIEVRIHLEQDLWKTQADPAQVESAVLNLVINARDAMPDGGTLTVETCNMSLGDGDWSDGEENDIKPGDYCVVSVSDNGSGMSPETAAKAFDPFFTTKAVGEGSGLGLSMIYGFAQQSGGAAKIYSEIGQGTTVRLYLPRARADLGVGKVDNAPVTMPRAVSETILLVEDNENVMRVAERQVQELGYSVLTARNGAEALAILDGGHQIDLLFTDVVMPGGMSGYELGRLAKERDDRIKILHTSGFTRPAADEIVEGLGSSTLLSKPYRKLDLALKLREVLDLPQSRDSDQRSPAST